MQSTVELQTLNRIFLHNLVYGWLSGHVKIDKCDDLFRVSVGSDSIYVVNPNRWRRYRRGIPRQLRRLANTYGALSHSYNFRDKFVLDIGANIGEFSLFAHANGAKVIAFEPDPSTLRALKKNIGDMGIQIIAKALWKETARLPLYTAPMSSDTALVINSNYDKILETEAVRLDDIVEQLGIETVFFIKGDAEGAEPEVLLGASATLRRTHYIALDCGPEREGCTTVQDVTNLLEDAGFNVHMLKRRRTVVFGTNRQFVTA